MELVQAVEKIGDLIKAFSARAETNAAMAPPSLIDLTDMAGAMQHLGEAVLLRLSEPPTVTLTPPGAFAVLEDIAKDQLSVVDLTAGTIRPARPDEAGEPVESSPLPTVAERAEADVAEQGIPTPHWVAAFFDRIAETWAKTAPANNELYALVHVLESLMEQAPALQERGLPGYLVEACEDILSRAGEVREEAGDLPECPKGQQPESRVMRSSPGEQWWITPKVDAKQIIWHVLADGTTEKHHLTHPGLGWEPGQEGDLNTCIQVGIANPIDELEARMLIFEAQAKRAERELEECRASYEATKATHAGDRERRERAEANLAKEVATVLELRAKVDGAKVHVDQEIKRREKAEAALEPNLDKLDIWKKAAQDKDVQLVKKNTALLKIEKALAKQTKELDDINYNGSVRLKMLEEEATEFKTKLMLAEAEQATQVKRQQGVESMNRELRASLANAEDARAATKHLLDTQLAKEAERVAAIERGIKDLVEGYWCKMDTAMSAMQAYARKGGWARLKTPLPYQRLAHIVGWDADLFRSQDRAVSEVFSRVNRAAEDDDAHEPGSQPDVHPV